MSKRLDIVEKSTGTVVESIDLTGETPRGAQQIRAGLRQQMNHEEYRIEERGPESNWVRCPGCHTSGIPHEVNGEECREAALERSISQSDDNQEAP